MISFLLFCIVNAIDVSISNMDSAIIDIVWCGAHNQSNDNILVMSSKGTIYLSQNNGDDWQKLAEVFHRKGLLVLQDENEKVGVVNKIQKSPIDPQLIIFLGTEFVNWISPDCGQTINAIYTGRQMREFQFHPKRKDWILASSWSKCQMKQKDCFVTKDLMISQDMGLNWEVIAKYVNQYSWGFKSPNNDVIPEQRILITYEPNGKGHQQLSGWNMKTHLFYSDDFMKTKTMLVNQGNKFQLTPNHIFVAQVMNSSNQEVKLLVSESDEYEYNFRYVQMPDILKDHSYTIVDSQYGAFININHLKPSSIMGTTYISDSTASRYRISLNYTVRTEEGQCDFERVLGLEGIYIANVYASEQAELYQSEIDEDSPRIKESDLSKFKQTKITFDKGSRWQPLTPPVVDSEGKKLQCDSKTCSLHLHSVSTKMQFGPFYSTKNSIGLILGTGNIGKYLSYRPDQVNTYMSRDGGLTWFEIAKGSHIYEIGDHGGVIVLASDQQATKVLKYSWNEGLTWEVFQFSEQAIEITNIITEPSNIGTRFIIYGTSDMYINDENIEQGNIVKIDFSQIHGRECIGEDQPSSENSDYELWSPTGKINPDCLMGMKVEYVRKKRDAKCFNGEDLQRQHSIQYCQCTEEDWECDLNFHRENQDINGKCIPYELYEQNFEAPENCEDYYEVTRGYRRVAGNKCQGGVEYNPVKLLCPGFKFWKFRNIWDFMLICIFVAIIYFIYKNKHHFSKKKDHTKEQQQSARTYGQKMVERGLGYREFDEDLIEENQNV
ncbi:unnamed protein product [Paramecium primaurelia]|uniref:VPS10 domain-containing protein n=1 Tax=Paramecium primaurelia TaxID=5886 RepID=A0A8S1KUH4_PARPR|nr:unnamed protein product [Paramecium primaurelia]